MKNVGTDLFDSARGYIERGWRVIPVHNPIERRELSPMEIVCSCYKNECANIGKHPRIRAWGRNASSNPQVIEQWWSRWPQANIGSPTGGLRLVLDIDDHDEKNGSVTLQELCDRYHFRIPETLTVMTGGGGYQKYLQTPRGVWIPSSAGKLGVGLDIRAERSFVVVPPSLHKSGRRYEFTCDAPLAPIPETLLTLLLPKQRWQDDGGVISLGQRHDFLFRLACSLRGKGANEAQILERVMDVNQKRCVPPETPEEVAYQAHWVATMYPAGRGDKGREYAMRNLHQLGVIATLKPSVQALLYFLERKCGDGSAVQLSYDEIIYAIGLAREAISRGLDLLVAIGLVDKQRGFKEKTGWRDRNAYRLTPTSQRFFQYCQRCRQSSKFELQY